MTSSTTRRRGVIAAVCASVALTTAAVGIGTHLATADDPDPIAAQATLVLDTFTGWRFLQFVSMPQIEPGVLMELAAAPAEDVRVGWFATTYREELSDLADMVGERLEIPPGELLAAWEATTDDRLRVMLTALSQLGDPYVWATDGPDGFDCSGLMRFAWAAADVDLPHLSVAQANSGEAVTPETLQVGDLVHAPGHIMMWLGARDAIVESSGDGVAVARWRASSDAFTDPTRPRTVDWLVPDGVERDATGRIIDPDAPTTDSAGEPVVTEPAEDPAEVVDPVAVEPTAAPTSEVEVPAASPGEPVVEPVADDPAVAAAPVAVPYIGG